MRIIQMLSTLAYGDAIGNHVIALRNALSNRGYETEIYADHIDERLPGNVARPISKYKDSKDVLILYHLSIGGSLNDRIKGYKAHIIIVYHNVTPPQFLEPYDERAALQCEMGLEGVRSLAKVPERCMADSSFNKSDLEKLGFTCPVDVVPILIRFSDYEKKPSQKVIHLYTKDDVVNILFAGRVAPNKKQEDLIASFWYYHNYINRKSRLIIAGSYDHKSKYYQKLRAYTKQLGLDTSVVFTGHIPFDELLAYYRIADVFVCLSEHEGFCVPLVEAMYFHIPVIAYDKTAVGETLGRGGILLKDKDPKVVAEMIHRVVSDQDLRQALIHNGQERLKAFDNAVIEEQIMKILSECQE